MSESRPIPKGRGAALLAALKRHEEKKIGVKKVDEPVEPPKPRGRAAVLYKLYQMKAQVGVTSAKERLVEVVVEDEGQTETIEAVGKSMSEMTVEPEKVSFKGTHGRPINLSANYIYLEFSGNKGVFEYEVRFDPDVDAKNRRIKLVNLVLKEVTGGVKVFDGGATLYLPLQITDTKKSFTTQLPDDPEKDYDVILIYKKRKQMHEKECMHLYNVLFKRIMYALMYTQMGKNYFNTHYMFPIPQHKLEVYPGFAVSADERENGLMLCLDTQHRVLRTQSAYELLQELRMTNPGRFKDLVTSNMIGACVFTRYNNKTYTVDDVAWDMNPRNTFETRDGGEISFIEYYKRQYNIVILDETQPLLVNRKTVKMPGLAQKSDRMICLIPELCYLTGLTDKMRADFKVMKDVAQHTRVTPQQRVQAMRTYLDSVKKSERAQQILADWGLRIGNDVFESKGRQLDNEVIYFGGDNKTFQTNNSADWSRPLGDNRVTGPVDIRNWIVFHTKRDSGVLNDFVKLMMRLGDVMGCRIAQPKIVTLKDDSTETYMHACRDHISLDNTQIVVFIVPTIRADRYAVIKKMCCSQIPVPSQVVTSRVLSNPQKVRTIVQKIALQMVAKMGGTLWSVRLPFKGWMVAGIDVYHAGPQKTSTCGLVCSLNEDLTRYMTLVNFQEKELGDYFKMAFTKILERYKNELGYYPAKLIIYRDGVSDSQFDHVRRYEVQQFQSVLDQFHLETQLTFIVVQKRINTRLFMVGSKGYDNPPPGTVLDHSVTKTTERDFYLVSQCVRQGTVNPTHYSVLRDASNMKPDIVQRLTYKLCHLYYNWSGTTRVPAPCLYAHKAAGMVGQHIKKIPAADLSDKLYYL